MDYPFNTKTANQPRCSDEERPLGQAGSADGTSTPPLAANKKSYFIDRRKKEMAGPQLADNVKSSVFADEQNCPEALVKEPARCVLKRLGCSRAREMHHGLFDPIVVTEIAS